MQFPISIALSILNLLVLQLFLWPRTLVAVERDDFLLAVTHKLAHGVVSRLSMS